MNTLCTPLRSTLSQLSLEGMIRMCSKGPDFQLNYNQLAKSIDYFKSHKDRIVVLSQHWTFRADSYHSFYSQSVETWDRVL